MVGNDMQSYFYLYSVMTSVALAVHLIINWHQLVYWRHGRPRVGARECSIFLFSLVVFFSVDVLWGIFAAFKWLRLLYADTFLFFLAMALSVLAWTRYVVVYLKMDGLQRSCLLWAGRGMLLIFIVSMAVNGFTHVLFRVDENCVYSVGPLRNLLFGMLLAFNALGSGMTLQKLLRTTGAIRRRNEVVFLFGLAMMAAIFLQLGDAFLPCYSLGCLFGCCLLHVFVFEDERDEMHRNEILARDYEAQLESERAANQAKSLFFSTVSHDIRTPLNAIVGFSELLERGVSDEAERAGYISSIRASGKLLARLVDDILDLSKMESGKLDIIEEPTDIPALAREVMTACEVAWSRNSLQFKSEIDDMPWVSVDPHRVRQILFNLLSNACKYTERGSVTVRVRWNDGTLSLSVADTGKGIAKDDIDRILQPFVQVADKNHRDGTGLGLAICCRLAKLMGGELTVSSEVGVGSTFTVALRGVKAVGAPTRRQEPARLRLAGGSLRVLVVDDSSVNRIAMRAMLAKCGVVDVLMAENGRRALEMLRGDERGFDLVLTDLWMPEMDGNGLVREVRSDTVLASLPVYLVTADVEARHQAESDGFSGVLLKPVSLEDLQSIFA